MDLAAFAAVPGIPVDSMWSRVARGKEFKDDKRLWFEFEKKEAPRGGALSKLLRNSERRFKRFFVSKCGQFVVLVDPKTKEFYAVRRRV